MRVHVQMVEEEVELKKGSHVRVLTAESDKDRTDETTIWVDYVHLPRVLEKGSKIYIDDGLIGLKVLEIGKSVVWWLVKRPACSSVVLLGFISSSLQKHKEQNDQAASQSKRVPLCSGAIPQRLYELCVSSITLLMNSGSYLKQCTLGSLTGGVGGAFSHSLETKRLHHKSRTSSEN